ncbi:MAG: hypothetical protein IJE70_03505 [Oscillospiraceae bacterium]|nr:hypothetical protein [Oscillospiraceae bacterium]
MNKDIILNGIHIGEHSPDLEKITDEIRIRAVEPGLNFVTIRPTFADVPQEYFIAWAKYLAENKIYFCFLYTVQFAPKGKDSMLEKDTVSKIKEVAGEYFLGDMIGETGSWAACMASGYFDIRDNKMSDNLRTDYADMKEAHETYIKNVSEFINIDKALGMPEILSVEATGLSKYNAEAGVTMPMLELMCGNPDILVSSLRGMARAYDSKLWGTYIAHEWYGGNRHDDTLKRKRLELAYKYAYLAGSRVFCLESGDELIDSHGYSFAQDSEICEDYRRTLVNMMEYIKNDARPCGGPKAKVAFVSGLHDAWGGWGGASVWNQFHREEWGHNEAENSLNLLYEIGAKRTWADVSNYGSNDLSSSPAYGMYDIVPIEAPVEKLCSYDYLIFLGWNSMTDENMDKLTEYVSRGGNLLMSAAHLNFNTARNGDFIPPSNEKLKKLFGVEFTGNYIRTNDGVKFRFVSQNEQLLFPGSKDFFCDPIYPGGYKDFAELTLCGGIDTAIVSNSFFGENKTCPAVIENKIGSGVATLVASTNYPGHPALLPLYRMIVREMITSSARNCDIKVIASDRLRYAVYEGNKIYLLNTDYDLPITVKIIHKEKELLITLDSLELKGINL